MPAPPTSVVIEDIIESPVDSGVPAPKKEQAMPAIKGFSHLILSLLGITESSPKFFQKGNPIVPTIWCFDPLVLPMPIEGISEAPSPKALEAALPCLVFIDPKIFSLVPNLQTQEGMVIHLLEPFPYKDSHCVPWKYNMTLITIKARKEEVCTNVSSGLSRLTRSG